MTNNNDRAAEAAQPASSDDIDWLMDQFANQADADLDAELRVGGPKRLVALDYFKRGYMLSSPSATSGEAPTDLRAEFEAWFPAVHGTPAAMLFRRLADDRRYEMLETEYAWLAFQHARIAAIRALRTPAAGTEGAA